MDSAGNLYGSAGGGRNGYHCIGGCGTVYELSLSGGIWTETILHKFRGDGSRYGGDGAGPNSLTFDALGNMYGSTSMGGNQYDNYGTVFMLEHAKKRWVYSLVHNFGGVEGFRPMANVIVNKAGNIFGTCYSGGTGDAGTIWELVYSSTNKSFTSHVLHMNAAGNIFGGAETEGGGGEGTFYKLVKSGKIWNLEVLHTFTGGADGGYPGLGVPLLEPSGKIFGLADSGGTFGEGVVFENTP